MQQGTRFPLGMFFVVLCACGSAWPGGHTWRVKEIFSNADGTIQYVEVWEANGTAGETGTAGHNVASNTNSFTIPSNVAAPTTNRSLLLATQGFADLGVVAPDYVLPSNFFDVNGDSISYTPFHTVTFVAGQLPTDGQTALLANLTTAPNSPQNYAGQTGMVDLGGGDPPPAVPALIVGVPDGIEDGSRLVLSYDTATCTGNASHQVVYGFGSALPVALGGVLGVSGAACSVAANPFNWTGVPDPTVDASRLLWFLMLATDDGTVEGSWGTDAQGLERVGPGPEGSSDQCGITTKDLRNACGI